MRVAATERVGWDEAIASLLGDAWSRTAAGDRGPDLVSRDGTRAVEVKQAVQGTRELHAALTETAIHLAQHPDLQRATLVAFFPRMSGARALEEWSQVTSVMKPDLVSRLGFVALTTEGEWTAPPRDRDAIHLAKVAREALEAKPSRPKRATAPQWSRKAYEVWKVLLDAWLTNEGALPLREIERRSGASYPSVAGVLDRLEAIGELERSRSRSAALTSYPRRSLAEVVTLGEGLRETHRFTDRSRSPASPTDLVRRLVALGQPTLALGGVVAARHYMPTFDLNGLPRVDVTIAPNADLT